MRVCCVPISLVPCRSLCLFLLIRGLKKGFNRRGHVIIVLLQQGYTNVLVRGGHGLHLDHDCILKLLATVSLHDGQVVITLLLGAQYTFFCRNAYGYSVSGQSVPRLLDTQHAY